MYVSLTWENVHKSLAQVKQILLNLYHKCVVPQLRLGNFFIDTWCKEEEKNEYIPEQINIFLYGTGTGTICKLDQK